MIATVPIGQAPQALTYVSNAVPTEDGKQNLQRPGVAGMAAHLWLAPPGAKAGAVSTSVTLFDQGLTQVLQAAVTGLEPKQSYELALATRPDGSGPLQSLAAFITNPAGAAIVNAVGPIRQIVQSSTPTERHYLVITSSVSLEPIQVQTAR